MLARVNELFLQKIDLTVLDNRLEYFSWDGGHAGGSVVTLLREETLYGMEQMSEDLMSMGTSSLVKDLLKSCRPAFGCSLEGFFVKIRQNKLPCHASALSALPQP